MAFCRLAFAFHIAALLSIGFVSAAEASGSQSVIGRLSVYREGPQDRLTASVIEARPGKIYQLANFEALARSGLPNRVQSGALVRVVGRRLSEGATAAGYRFVADSIALVRPAPPSKLVADGTVKPQAVAGVNLKTLVLRPRLPLNCTANRVEGERTSGNSPQGWVDAVKGVNQLQQRCTGGRLTYQVPVVSAYVDIPCTPMPKNSNCAFSVIEAWSEDARSAADKLGIDTASFDHIVFDLPKSLSCPWAARAILTWREVYANGLTWPAGLAHEFGHNYGLPHAAYFPLAPNGPLPDNMPIDNVLDDTNLMGYSVGAGTCFSFPSSALIGLAAPVSQMTKKNLRAGKTKSVMLRPTWAKEGQGVSIAGFRAGQRNWTIWASYQLTTSSPYRNLLDKPIYNKAVIIHLSSSDYISWTVPFVYRIRVLQSGDVFRWPFTRLAFKFADVAADGQSAELEVCRETKRRKCNFDPGYAGASKKPLVRLAAPSMDPSSPSWCLRTCGSESCRDPTTTSRVWFNSPCRKNRPSLWYSVAHASGYVRWVNKLSGKCLAVDMAAGVDDWGANWWEMKYKLVAAPCNTDTPPDFRTNPQLFLPQQATSDSGLVTLRSGLLYPQCPGCGVDHEVCVEPCDALDPSTGSPKRECARGVPRSRRNIRNVMALAGRCWKWDDTREVDRQLIKIR